MRRFTLIILLVGVLVAMVTGCGDAPRYDGRLLVADSLMNVDPDSALAIIEAVNPDSLATEGDRAYRDLLLTQARYKCYVVATSDSDINRALDYYSHHSKEREKLTRAYIFKGAVMEELGQPDSAMLHYKQAEATATPDDYFNLGYSKLRIADLYRLNYVDAQISYNKFKEALHYNRLANNKRLEIDCLFSMAGFSGIMGMDNSNTLLRKASDLAEQENDRTYYFMCQELLCRQLSRADSTLIQAKSIANHCLDNYPEYVNNDLLLDLAHIYAAENDLDSACFFLNYVNDHDSVPDSGQVRVRKLETLSTIASKKGDLALSHLYMDSCYRLVDSIESNHHKYSIRQVEDTQNKALADKKNQTIRAMRTLFFFLVAVMAGLIIFLLIHRHRRNQYLKSILKELAQIKEFDGHDQLLQQLDDKDTVIHDFVHNMIQFMRTSIDTSENDSPKVIRRRIDDTISEITTDEFWTALRSYMDTRYHNMITEIARNPSITEVDLRYIELFCLDFNYVEIAITLGVNPNYVSTKRKAIAKKLRISEPLKDFLKRKMGQNME